jgi:hypothetical protein
MFAYSTDRTDLMLPFSVSGFEEFMVKRSSKAMEFYSEYHQISIALKKLGWDSAE